MKPRNEEFMPTRWTLIERMKNWDDQESWRQLFDTYWKLIDGVARQAGLTPEEAQDAVQETVRSVCKNIGEFRADPAHGSFKRWLLRLSHWRILDQVRKRPAERGRLRGPSSPSANFEPSTTRTEERVADPADNQFEALWDAEWDRHLISLALEKVEKQANARHYQVFLLHVIKQHPAEQVAKMAGVDTSQVYLIKHRLTPLFREAIRELEM